MTARVLVVDDIAVNLKLLEARLSAEYFDVLTAASGRDCIDICARERVDIILLDVMMPGLDGFDTCRALKSNPRTHDIPVIMVTALDQVSDRVRGLECGADDFLAKPVDDIALVTRVRNLARLKTLNDEMMMRTATWRSMGVVGEADLEKAISGRRGRIMIVDDRTRSSADLVQELTAQHEVRVVPDAADAAEELSEDNYDLALISLNLSSSDGLRLCSRLRALEQTRHLPIIMLVEAGSEARLLRGLELGVSDYLIRPIDNQELRARVGTQIKRKRYSDHLRNRLEACFELSIKDPLTKLYNRRYLENHLERLVDEARDQHQQLSVLMVDIDHFKAINDTHGHAAGDTILREFASRLRKNTRGADLTARIGGEEFVIVMPDTDRERAQLIGERLCTCIAERPFEVRDGVSFAVTASIGLGGFEGQDDTPDTVLKRADRALYAAKRLGRNRFAADAA